MPLLTSAKFDEYTNLQNFEATLKARYKSSLHCKNFTFDLSKVEWIGPLQICILYGWLQELLKNKVSVNFEIGSLEKERQAISFITNAGFFENLSERVEISNLPIQYKNSGLSAFKTFNNSPELETFRQAISSTESCNQLLGASDNIDVIRDGDLRDILINELCQNGLIHGESNHVRFAVSEFPLNPDRSNHKYLDTFGGKSYIEIAVSDSGPGIIETLSKKLPSGYHPVGKFIDNSNNEATRLISYAFEFSSTSNEDERRKRLERIYSENKIEYEAIPTGLFYVYSLAKSYGGQIIVRTADTLVSINLSTPSNDIIYTKSNLTRIPGTHILVRFPRTRNRVTPKLNTYPIINDNFENRTHRSDVLTQIPYDLDWQSKLITELEKAVFQQLVSSSTLPNPIVSVILYGIPFDTKAFAIFITILASLPRKNCALLAMGISNDLVDSSIRQWARITEIRKEGKRVIDRVHGFRSLILVSEDINKQIEFGDTEHVEATRLSEENDNRHLSLTRSQVELSQKYAIINGLSQLIQSECVQYTGDFYFLIESKYYTKTFFQISKLLSHPTGKHLSSLFIKMLINKKNINVVFTISEPLFNFSNDISKQLNSVRFENIDPNAKFTTMMKVLLSIDKSTLIAVFCDVICTANEIQNILSKTPSLDNVIVICFVDARDDEYDYVTVKRKDRPYAVKIYSALRYRISPIYDLPKVALFPILTIDKKTHTPTSYDEIYNPPKLSPEEILDIATNADALYQGHFNYLSKHYSMLLYFPTLFAALSKQFYAWWNKILKEFNDRKIQPNEIKILYLDEKKGWEQLIYNHFVSKGISNIISISRDLLDAPPVDVPQTKCIWFIIPAIASGVTTMKCLEIASRYKPDNICLSIILARIDSATLSFYQNITGYKNCSNLQISMMTWMPIPSYLSDATCPKCNALKLIKDISLRVENYDSLLQTTIRPYNLFRCIDLDPSKFNTSELDVYHSKNPLLATLRAHFEESKRNINHRRKYLGPLLDNPEMCRCFIEMIGEEFLLADFDPCEVERVTYTRFNLIKKEAEILLNKQHINDLSLPILLGIHRLFPSSFSNKYSQLLNTALSESNKDLFEDLVFLALLEPTIYVQGLLTQTELTSPTLWFHSIIKDIREFPHWYETPESYSISSFYYLLWLLRRSTPWGMNLEYLRALLKNSSSSNEINQAIKVLKTEGIDAVLSHFNKICERKSSRSGSLLSALRTINPKIDSVPINIRKIFYDLSNQKKFSNSELMLSTLASLDKEASLLVETLTKLFTNPIDALIRIEEMKLVRWSSSSLKIRFTIAKNQPGILFLIEDLIQCLCSVIDNAVQFITSNGDSIDDNSTIPEIQINFAGYTSDKLASVLIVSDNIPWKEKIVPDGGLKQFSDYCKKFGAIYDFDPQAHGEKENVRIKVIIKIDKEGFFNVQNTNSRK